jgi:amino acid permease
MYAEDGAPAAANITREDKIAKAHEMMDVEEGATVNADDQLLATLGYRAELKREFSYLTVFGQSFGAMGIAPAIAESMIFSLGSAGAVGMVWTYLVGCILLIPVALSLGELGSSMPTAGGLYYVSLGVWQQRIRLMICSGLHDLRHLNSEHSCAGLRRSIRKYFSR